MLQSSWRTRYPTLYVRAWPYQKVAQVEEKAEGKQHVPFLKGAIFAVFFIVLITFDEKARD